MQWSSLGDGWCCKDGFIVLESTLARWFVVMVGVVEMYWVVGRSV